MANLDGNAPLFALAGPGHWNDADMLVVGIPPELSDGEKRAHFSLWCVMASPLLIGCDLRSANATTLAVLKNAEAIAVDQDPLGFQGRKISDDGSHEIFAKAMSDGSMAIVLFNRGAATATMTINWSSLGFQGAMTVRDLWQHQDLGSLANGYSTTVPSHDAAMLRLFPNANTTSTAVTISGLTASSDGLPHPVTVTTTPPGQTVVVTYNGSTTVPTSPGTYTVVATINDANATHMGSATGVMVIAGTDEGKRRCGTGVGFAILSLFSFMLLPLRRSRWR
jgi:alpha-galactosidase